MNKPKPDAKAKGGYAPASLARLLAIAGDSGNEPIRIALADIDEDAGQPRKVIETDALTSLAATIRSYGVLQPIGVHPPVNGRYQLAFGARRVRASLLAGKVDIPAVIVAEGQRNFASQVVENQQRANLTNSDLAAAIVQLQSEDVSSADIAIICNLKDYQVTAYRAVARFPDFLRKLIDTADVRALYDLFRQWRKTPAEVEARMPEGDLYLTITETRRIIEAIAGVSTGSIFLQTPTARDSGPVEDEADASGSGQNVSLPDFEDILHSAELAAPPTGKSDDSAAITQPKIAAGPKGPIFIVAIGNGERGELVVDRRAQAPGWALVRFSTGIEEVEFTTLRTVAIE